MIFLWEESWINTLNLAEGREHFCARARRARRQRAQAVVSNNNDLGTGAGAQYLSCCKVVDQRHNST